MPEHERLAFPRLIEALGDRPVVAVVGPRQCGKTTLARRVARERPDYAYVTLDDPTVRAAALAGPDGFLAGFTGPLVIDEVQVAPDLLRAIKLRVDEDRRPGRYLLTGSANLLTVPRISESLAGRIEILRLGPLTRREIDAAAGDFTDWLFAPKVPAASAKARGGDAADRRRLLGYVASGGFPEALAAADPERRAEWFKSYETTILLHDLRDVARIPDVSAASRLLRCVAARTAKLSNFADLARDADLAHMTARRHFAYLETLFMAERIPAWARNPSKRMAKAPKLIVPDSGLACHLLNAGAERLGEDAALRGALVETFVIGEILRQAAASRRRPSAWHYRSHSGAEVDLVLEDRDGRVVGVEITSADAVEAADFRGIDELADEVGRAFAGGVVLHAGRGFVPFRPGRLAAPLSTLWADLPRSR